MFIGRRAAFLALGTIFEHYTGYEAYPDAGAPAVAPCLSTAWVLSMGFEATVKRAG